MTGSTPVSFEGSAYLFPYYSGVVEVFLERGVILPGETQLSGLSGGAFTATLTTVRYTHTCRPLVLVVLLQLLYACPPGASNTNQTGLLHCRWASTGPSRRNGGRGPWSAVPHAGPDKGAAARAGPSSRQAARRSALSAAHAAASIAAAACCSSAYVGSMGHALCRGKGCTHVAHGQFASGAPPAFGIKSNQMQDSHLRLAIFPPLQDQFHKTLPDDVEELGEAGWALAVPLPSWLAGSAATAAAASAAAAAASGAAVEWWAVGSPNAFTDPPACQPF